ncbi:hypothetical protein L1887_37042 [Cichorium endivia]|nr:hypothetical protein L1887_37042 [Cichorium endivia]
MEVKWCVTIHRVLSHVVCNRLKKISFEVDKNPILLKSIGFLWAGGSIHASEIRDLSVDPNTEPLYTFECYFTNLFNSFPLHIPQPPYAA